MAKVTKDNNGTIEILVSPEEVADAVRAFAWYKLHSSEAGKKVADGKYVFGICQWTGEVFQVKFMKEIPVPKS